MAERGRRSAAEDDSPEAKPPSGWRRYAKWATGLLAALGILGAIGSNLVDAIWPDVAERVGGDGPLRISVREDPQGGADGFQTATHSAAGLEAKLARARDCDSLFDASKAAGAVDVDKSIHHLLLEGRTHRDVAIVDMRARILKREPRLRGARISCATSGGVKGIGVAFDLDEPAPRARTTRPGDRPGAPYFGEGNVITLAKTELQPVRVVARASEDYVEWEIDARLIVDGEERKLRINDRGQPFRLTAARRLGDYARHFEWLWYEPPGRLYAGARPNR